MLTPAINACNPGWPPSSARLSKISSMALASRELRHDPRSEMLENEVVKTGTAEVLAMGLEGTRPGEIWHVGIDASEDWRGPEKSSRPDRRR